MIPYNNFVISSSHTIIKVYDDKMDQMKKRVRQLYKRNTQNLFFKTKSPMTLIKYHFYRILFTYVVFEADNLIKSSCIICEKINNF